MHMKKKYTIPVAIVFALVAITVVGVTSSVAAQGPRDHGDIVQKLVERFNLDQTEVESFFDEIKQERQAERQARIEESLTQAVSGGKITEEQKQALLGKMQENQAEREGWIDLSDDERRDAMRKHREEMRAWAQEQGIDLRELMPVGGRGERRGQGRSHSS